MIPLFIPYHQGWRPLRYKDTLKADLKKILNSRLQKDLQLLWTGLWLKNWILKSPQGPPMSHGGNHCQTEGFPMTAMFKLTTGQFIYGGLG
ncbi:hypothetical protein Y1Q_0005191 [Alligator mississippiensis]|uniref:Uncharacterized protein n=1 Tax=Alligator mississippiensis TaxID=8496 RepID=A0A151MSY7_ALLMI|nr:hypothetical protein Y1Q_0005191 [Alligator mississippiensis]